MRLEWMSIVMDTHSSWIRCRWVTGYQFRVLFVCLVRTVVITMAFTKQEQP